MQRLRGLAFLATIIAAVACGSEKPQRATLQDGFDITQLRSEITRSNGETEDVGDDELFLAQGNRALTYLTIQNSSDGWAPINFETCIDHADALAIVDPHADPRSGALLDEPCVVRYDTGEQPIVQSGTTQEFHVVTVEAKPQPSGGYFTIYFRVEFEKVGEIDLYEYTVPYRVLP